MKHNETPRVLARLTSEELERVNAAGPGGCQPKDSVDQDGNPDKSYSSVNLDTGACD